MGKFNWQNKTVVITGGSSGLGLELARMLCVENDVILLARDKKKLKAAKLELEMIPGCRQIAIYPVDVLQSAQLNASFKKILAGGKKLDALFNCAGILAEGEFGAFPKTSFENIIRVNLFGTVNACRAALPHLIRPGSKIINIASMSGVLGVFGYSAYCASKHAVLGFSRSLHHELQSSGISVHSVCPPEFDSPMVDAITQSRSAKNLAHTGMIPQLSAQKVARATLIGAQKNRLFIYPGILTRITALLYGMFPALVIRVSDFRIKMAK